MYSGVPTRPPHSVIERPVGQRLRHRLGDPKVDDARDRPIVRRRHQDVRRFQVPVDDAFLMRVLNAVAQLNEQLNPVADRQPLHDRSTR